MHLRSLILLTMSAEIYYCVNGTSNAEVVLHSFQRLNVLLLVVILRLIIITVVLAN